MDRWLLSVVTCLLVIGSQISITIGSATLKVKLAEFTNPSNKKFDGSCCDVPCGTPCQYFYELCVQDEPRNKPPCEGPSNMSRYSDGVLPDVEFTIANWTEASKEEGYLNLKLMVYDVDDGGYLEAVDYVILEVKGNESDTTIQAKGTFIADTNFAVTLTYKCDENYYGLQCDKMCAPQDSVTGHFKCDNVTGEKSCMDGWTGGDCTTATQPCAGTAPPETGVPVGSCQAIDMLFLLDSSASVNEIDANNWDNLKKFVKGIIDRVILGPASFQIGIILVGNKANYSIKLSEFHSNDELKSSIEALTYEGLQTNLKDGLKLARTEGFKTSNGGRKGAYKCVVVAYAGAALRPAYGAVDKEASGLKDLAVDVFVVSLKQGKSQQSVIESIASQPPATHIWTDLEDWTKLASTVGPTILANAQDKCQRTFAATGTTNIGTTLAGFSGASSSTVSTTRSSTGSTTGSTAGSINSTGAAGGSTTPSSSGGPLFVAQCHFRGTCSAESPSSTCYCMAGYSGENCEEEVDPCDSDPCNGGECESGSDGDFICKSCLPGFSGDHCEVVGEEILCAPCTEGSDAPGCPPPGASPQCPALPEAPCADHLYGTDCKTFCVPRDDCIEGHYTCDEEGQKVCMPGWKDGTKPCTVPDTETTANCTNTCANGGACYAAGCCCPEGFKGPDCSETTGNMSTPVGTNTTGTTPGINSTGATTPDTNSTGATTPGTNSTGATTPGTNSTGATTPGTNSTGATTPGTNSTGSTVAETGSTVAQTQGTGTTARTTMGTATMVSMGSATSGPVTSGGTSTTPKDNMAECLKQIGDFFKFSAPFLSPVQKQAVLNLYLPACLDSSE